MSQQIADLLRRARKRISTMDTWCQGTAAQDCRGNGVLSLHPDACRWCAIGAINAETANVNLRQLGEEALNAVCPRPYGAEGVNDLLGHAAVLKMYDNAIVAQEAA